MRKITAKAIFILSICSLGMRGAAQIYPTQKDHDIKVDSFLHVLSAAKEDTNKVNTLNTFGNELLNWSEEEQSKAMENFRLALSLSEKLNYQKGKGDAYFWMANALSGEVKYEQALQYYSDALKLREIGKDYKGMSQCYLGIGAAYVEQKDYSKALSHYNTALRFAGIAGDKKSIAEAYQSLGLFFLHSEPPKYPEALKYYLMVLKIGEEIDDKEWMSVACNQIGISYLYLEDYANALKYFLEDEKKTGESNFVGNFISCYRGLKDYREGINVTNLFIEKYKKEGNKRYVVFSLGQVGLLYREMAEELNRNNGNPDIIADYLDKSLKNFEASKQILLEKNPRKIYTGIKYDYGVIYKIKAELLQKNRSAADQIKNNLNIALGYFLEQLKDTTDQLFNLIKADCYVKIGETLSAQTAFFSEKDKTKKYNESLQYLDTGLVLAKATADEKAAKNACWGMIDIYEKTRNYEKAIETLKYYDVLKDSITKDETDKKVEQMRIASEVIVGATEERSRYEKVINDLNFNYLKKEDSLRFQEKLAGERFKQKQKEVQLKQAELALANQQNELNQLAYLKTQAQLQTEQSQREEKEKQLIISGQQQDLQKNQLALQQTQLDLNESQLQSERKQRFFYAGGSILMLLIFGFIYYNFKNRQKILAMIAAERLKIEKADAAHKMTELELQSLRTQLNPHFMFNSLNAIQELILMEDNENSHVYLSRFAELLRMLLDNATQPFIPLKKEINFLELYLSLESLRIPDIQHSIELDPRIQPEKMVIPNMILQPYIENAIWHGLSHKKNNKKLQIRIHQKENAIIFEIEDNGVGRKKAIELKGLYRKEHRSRGMELLSKRFNLLSKEYGADIVTRIIDLADKRGDAAGTLVEITVPSSLSEKAKKNLYDTSNYS